MAQLFFLPYVIRALLILMFHSEFSVTRTKAVKFSGLKLFHYNNEKIGDKNDVHDAVSLR